MAFWHVAAFLTSRERLWRTGVYSFWVVEPGEPVDLLTNDDYGLFHRKYEGALRSTGVQLQLTPIVVTDQVRQLVGRHYLEARVPPAASREEIWPLASAGPLIRRYGADNSVFASNALKNLLQLVDDQKLGFSPGLMLFGG